MPRVLAQLASEERRAKLDTLARLSATAFARGADDEPTMPAGDVWRRVVEDVVECSDEVLREALQPAVTEYLLAADVADQVGEILTRASARLLDVQRKARAGDLEIVHGTLSDTAVFRAPRRAFANSQDHVASGPGAAIHASAAAEHPANRVS